MSVKAVDVRPGKCFLSQGARPQVVRVLSVRDSVVRFEARGRGTSWSQQGDAELGEFVAGLVREVGSDYKVGAAPRLHV